MEPVATSNRPIEGIDWKLSCSFLKIRSIRNISESFSFLKNFCHAVVNEFFFFAFFSSEKLLALIEQFFKSVNKNLSCFL